MTPRLIAKSDDTASPAMRPLLDSLDFTLPPELEAGEPPEARGLARDEVRLLVSSHGGDTIRHLRFRDLGDLLTPGDLLVLNTSGTLNAALPAQRTDGTALEVHLSTHQPDGCWTVEVRRPSERGTLPFGEGVAGEVLALPAGGGLTLRTPYAGATHAEPARSVRLWLADLRLPLPLIPYLDAHGAPIRYGYVRAAWPSSAYQTVYATEPGSAEMPSAGRAFSADLITALVAHGIRFAPLLLHTGVSSLEEHDPPYAEAYRVPGATARLVNSTCAEGGRVIAVGTTVVRALETVGDRDGTVHSGEGWTDVIITPERGIQTVTGMLTGLHEPRASHLAMLEALAGRAHLRAAYAEALRAGYLWHEFGDLHLILP